MDEAHAVNEAAPQPSRGEAPYPPLGPGPDSELTWLLHRAAQRMHAVTGSEAARHGLTLRDHIVLSALHKTENLTQIELGQALGVDKTTLTAEIDRLVKAGYVTRLVDPRDRRARIPVITPEGDSIRAAVAQQAEDAETAAVQSLTPDQIALLREALYLIIGTTEDPGSCI
ncbi:MarR family transcriptional regulator [Kineosporia sp. NBRC 101731]|uniref:MarR family winged helix-turn-helix transcriptional regulator n=1 Tax=Kineosporia sp. NBRC 101731 TaxID=3032199 RepID=UPI0024A207A8|nr:MarR family transcriptional regulator [Kineosporia sp. NBRC 101731]GLY30786.1 MarR family transcriptional regulator [Kineosporia sp. NBRC 101731]